MSTEVTTQRTPEQCVLNCTLAAEFFAGKHPDPTGQVARIMHQFAVSYLECVRKDYAIKAAGGSGADGTSWPDLSPATKVKRMAPHKRKGERPIGLLTDAQDKRWRSIFGGVMRGSAVADKSQEERESSAAAIAWHVLKAEGARTMREVYGNVTIPILIEKGDLLGSLIPGHPKNILEVRPDGVTVGTSDEKAVAHQFGVPSRKLPARPIFPEEIPDSYADKMLEDVLPLLQGMIVELVR